MSAKQNMKIIKCEGKQGARVYTMLINRITCLTWVMILLKYSTREGSWM